MNSADFWALVRHTLFEPRTAAARILALRLPVEAAWAGLALMAVLNTLVYTLSIRMSPPADPTAMGVMGPAFHTPLIFAVMLFGALALTALALTYVGRYLGGQGTLTELVPLLAWMQVMRLLVQMAIVVLALAVPVLAAALVLVSAVWGIVILLAFVAVAHGYSSLFRAAGAVVLSIMALAVALSVLLSLVGVTMVKGM
ncbi:YIP1 family protein [Roseovarius autotrophicus]|uniref:YIP1 family protein n=1 Tax=Roseovarius autotrophicus TaxID=2824121 RepID=UPI001FFDC6EF|nr:YIP1 family protein [Roseovarius autotrophicus]